MSNPRKRSHNDLEYLLQPLTSKLKVSEDTDSSENPAAKDTESTMNSDPELSDESSSSDRDEYGDHEYTKDDSPGDSSDSSDSEFPRDAGDAGDESSDYRRIYISSLDSDSEAEESDTDYEALEQSLQSDEDEYDNDPELLANTKDDSEDDTYADEEEADMLVELIRSSERDLGDAQRNATHCYGVYKAINIRDGVMERLLENLRCECERLLKTNILAVLNGDDIKQDDAPCLDELRDIWERMDAFIEHLWFFSEKYSGCPPALKTMLNQLHALDYEKELETDDGDTFHNIIFEEKADDLGYYHHSSEEGWRIDDFCYSGVSFDFEDEPNVPEDGKFITDFPNPVPFQELYNDTADMYRMHLETCQFTINVVKDRFPKVWEKCAKTDHQFDNMTTLEAIHTDQQSTDTIIPKDRIRMLIAEVFLDTASNSATRMDEEAIEALHVAAEDYLIKVLGGAQELATYVANRAHINEKDILAYLRAAQR